MPLNIPKVFVETPSGTIPPFLPSRPPSSQYARVSLMKGYRLKLIAHFANVSIDGTHYFSLKKSGGPSWGLLDFLKWFAARDSVPALYYPPAPLLVFGLCPQHDDPWGTPEGDNLPKSDWRCISDTTQFMWRLSRIFELWKSFNISPPPYHLSELTEAASSKLDTTKPKKCKSGENAITKWLSFKNLIDLSIRIH